MILSSSHDLVEMVPTLANRAGSLPASTVTSMIANRMRRIPTATTVVVSTRVMMSRPLIRGSAVRRSCTVIADDRIGGRF